MDRLKSIQGLRALAFLEVFLAHCGLSPFQGVLGVSLFMLMSGFCMALNYLPRVERLPAMPAGCMRFALNKVKKLYVLHVVMTLCAMLIRGVPTMLGGLALLAGACIAALAYLRIDAFAPAGFKYNLLMLPVAALMLLCVVLSGGAIGRAVSGRLITRLGDMSSCAFLIHQIVIQGVRMLMARYGIGQGSAGGLVLFCVSFALTLAITRIYILLEGRLRRRTLKA